MVGRNDDFARQFVLRDAQWQFAKRVEPLQLRTEEQLEWVYAYQYPIDCLKLRKVFGDLEFKQSMNAGNISSGYLSYNNYIEPADVSVPYELINDGDNRIIGTDLEDAYAMYTKDVKDTTLFDPTFTSAFIYYLASMIAVPLTGVDIGRVMREDMLKLYGSTMSSAVAHDLNEQRRTPRPEPDLVSIRRS